MAVYDPSGSGGVHMDKAISGKKAVQPKKATKATAAQAKKKKGK